MNNCNFEIVCSEDFNPYSGDGNLVEFTDAIAYSGGTLPQYWSGVPVVVDLAGMSIAPQVTLMYDHEYEVEARIGEAQVTNTGTEIKASGKIINAGIGAMIVETGRKIPWQLSIGARNLAYREIPEETTINVNGREFTGPLLIVTKSLLREISVVALGADENTKMEIAASLRPKNHNQKGENNMVEKVTAATEQPVTKDVQASATPENPVTPVAPAIQAQGGDIGTLDVQAAVNAALTAHENKRKETIAAINKIFGDEFPQKKAELIAAGASVEEAKDAFIDMLRAGRTEAGTFNIFVKGENKAKADDVFTAAALLAAGNNIDLVAKECGKEATEAAEREYGRSLGLKDMVMLVAKANGCKEHTLSYSNLNTIAGYLNTQAAGVGFTPISLPGIFSNVVNKSVQWGYGVPDTSWRKVAKISSVRDFKETYHFRLGLGGGFQKVAPGGEIKNSTLTEDSYTNKAETYGAMITIDRTHIINDDLGALTEIPYQYGMTAARSQNKVIWETFLNNSTFFSSDNNNLITKALSIEGLTEAQAKFAHLKDKNGELTGLQAKYLLVPASLEVLAMQLYKDINIISVGGGSSKATAPAGNPFNGKYEPIASPYLDDPSMTGYSATAWYLLADPREAAAIDVVFLDGMDAPKVENFPAGVNVLGWSCRAVMDFGVTLADPRAGVKSSGNA